MTLDWLTLAAVLSHTVCAKVIIMTILIYSLSFLFLKKKIKIHVEANLYYIYIFLYFLSTAVVCGSVLPLRGSCPPGGHRQWLRFPQPQIQPSKEQQEHRLLQRQTHAERGERRGGFTLQTLLLKIQLLKGVFVFPDLYSLVVCS